MTILAFPRGPRQTRRALQPHAPPANGRIFQPRPRRESGIAGLFWMLPLSAQRQRMIELHRSQLNAETIAIICRLPISEVLAVIESQG
jgi:hypothetical protein